jgi:hypothetical protein
MEKFAIDLDKVLDDFELQEGKFLLLWYTGKQSKSCLHVELFSLF